MAKCEACQQEMQSSVACTATALCFVMLGESKDVPRISYTEFHDQTHNCHDCGVPPGAMHHLGCGMEKCPLCGGQLISCDHTEFIKEVIINV